MDLMNQDFRMYFDLFMIFLIGDTFIYSRSKDDHMDHLRIVLQIIKDNQLFAKFIICDFWLRSVDFLGDIVSSKGVDI